MLLYKNSVKKIIKSIGRFLSLIFIVALGSAFFSGVRETSSDMIKTMDNYYDDYALMDFRIVSTMGLTDNDVKSLQELNNSLKVVPSYSYETLIDGESTKIYSYQDNINKVNLISGKMPTKNGEILVENGTYQIGDIITLESGYEDYLKTNTYTVVGTITSPLYIYDNKGISTVGDGKLDTFMYVLPSNFNMGYYTEIYLTAKDSLSKTSYEKDYLETIELLEKELKELKPIRETARYEEIKEEAMIEIYDAEEKLQEETETNGKKLEEAKNTLDKTETELNQAEADYYSGLNTLNQTKETTETKLANSNQELAKSKAIFKNSLKNYGIEEDEINTTLSSLNSQIQSLEKQLENIDPSSKEYEEIESNINNLKTFYNNLEKLKETKETLDEKTKELEEASSTWKNTYTEKLNDLNNAYTEIENGKQSLKEGQEEYQKNYATYQEEIKKANEKITKAKEDLENLEKPEWYLLTREDNSGYTTFYEAATKIDSIASVFPIFFIIVAFLMGMNTMTRMIEEERSEIGLFTSLGISKAKIITSYITYVLIATFIGLVIGLLIGYYIVPHALFGVYTASFTIPDLITYFNFNASTLIVSVAIITMVLVTYITVNRNFKNNPAELLRPEAPKKGTKVLLERFPVLWKKLSFTWKVTIRNMFRYKKRIIMTIVGITGCTALLLTGFGIKDSINSLLEKQFEDIITYDSILLLNEEINSPSNNITKVLTDNNIDSYRYMHMESYTFSADNKTLDTYVMAFENSNIDKFLNLKDLNGNKITLSDDGVVITEKMADLLGVKIGDTINIRNNQNELFILKVENICQNYVNHYIYMTDTYYNEAIKDISYNAIMTNMDNTNKEETGTNLINSNYFSSIQYTDDSKKMLEDVINSMNDIVYLIIGFSTFLAITVLYNLTTINISERRREIATLKVLGFYNKEVSTYVYRETVILTIFGIILGVLGGLGLNLFVLMVAETDEILFVKDIHVLSYVYTFLIMIAFTLIVQFITSFILRKINMIDSLKSVE